MALNGPPPVVQTTAPTAAHGPELEAAIEADPFDVHAYLVYADWLQAKGDPRGELIALMCAAESSPSASAAANALLVAHQARFYGPLGAHLRTHDYAHAEALRFRYGFLHRAQLSNNKHSADGYKERDLVEILELVLAHPSGRFLVDLALGINNENMATLDDVIALLAERKPAALRRLELGLFTGGPSWFRIGDLRALWKALPRLSTLIVNGDSFELGAIHLPEAQRVELHTGDLTVGNADAVARASWPKLEHLDLWLGTRTPAVFTKLQPLLERTDLPALRRLAIQNTAITDEICTRLVSSGLVGQLRELDLSIGTMTDAGARTLASQRSHLQLDLLDVSRNRLTPVGIQALDGLATTVIAQRMTRV
ncbi:MAG: hypothetical protein H6Q90_3688 [Deltaproteobacteria bacterium]|nr:hypothetical protein [Deltaproteobacteria bacterium]